MPLEVQFFIIGAAMFVVGFVCGMLLFAWHDEVERRELELIAHDQKALYDMERRG